MSGTDAVICSTVEKSLPIQGEKDGGVVRCRTAFDPENPVGVFVLPVIAQVVVDLHDD